MQKMPFYAFLTANAISLAGNALTMVAVPWFVLETGGSAAQVGLVGFFTALPAVLAAFLGGTLVDRLGHKQSSIVADLASGVTVALIPLLYATVGLQFWQLLVLVFLGALLDAPGNTARQALLPDVAKNTGMRLERANALQQTVQRLSMLIGPALAGVLIMLFGASNVLWVDAATFVVSAALFAVAVPAVGDRLVDTEPYLAQIRAGLAFIRGDRLLLTLLLIIATTNFLDAPVFAVILPVYAEQAYGSAANLGIMLSAFGAGAVISALVFGAIGHRLPRRGTFIISFVLVSVPFFVLAQMPAFPAAVGALAFAGLAAGPINPLLMTVIQERVPSAMRGRVFGMIMATALVAAPLGMVLAGLAVETVGVSATLLGMAICYLAVTASQVFNRNLCEMSVVPASTQSA